MSLSPDSRNSTPQDPSLGEGLRVVFHALYGTLLSRKMRNAWEEERCGGSTVQRGYQIASLGSVVALAFALIGAKVAVDNPSPASSTGGAAGIAALFAWERNRRVLRQPARIASTLEDMRKAELKAEVVFFKSERVVRNPRYHGLESPLLRHLEGGAACAELDRATKRFQQASAEYGVPNWADVALRIPQPAGNPQELLPAVVHSALRDIQTRPLRPPFYTSRAFGA